MIERLSSYALIDVVIGPVCDESSAIVKLAGSTMEPAAWIVFGTMMECVSMPAVIVTLNWLGGISIGPYTSTSRIVSDFLHEAPAKHARAASSSHESAWIRRRAITLEPVVSQARHRQRLVLGPQVHVPRDAAADGDDRQRGPQP